MDKIDYVGSYVSLTTRKDQYFSQFYNPITRKYENLHVGTREDCFKKYCERQIEFYSENKLLMPKSIHIHRGKKFKVEFTIKLQKKNKPIYIGCYDSLQEAICERGELIVKIMQ